MIKALVFGKFLPFHKGHEAMINFALSKCDFLSIIPCASDKESINIEQRVKWIKETFADKKNIEIIAFNYLEKDLENTSKASRSISEAWAKEFKKICTNHQLIISSEAYGEYVAEYMGIEHIAFDMQRNNVHISATAIRNNLFDNWNFLPNSVKKDLAIKIIILGSESTGKSTLSEALAKHFQATLVSEAGRDIVENSKAFAFEDLYIIAEEHAQRIDNAAIGKNPLLIIDTDIHITMSYAEFIFKKKLVLSKDIFESNKGNLYLYLDNDVPFVQDGTRLDEDNRNLLNISHKKILNEYGIEYITINGNWENRLLQAIAAIEQLIHNYTLKYRKE